MKRLATLIKWDFRLQFKYNLIYAAAYTAAFLFLILHFLVPHSHLKLFLPFILFTDPAIIGFYFLGALIFFERSERTLQGLMVTPVRLTEYFLSKIITLTVIALSISYIVVITTYGLDIDHCALILAIGLTSVFYVLIGFIFVVRVRSFNVYLMSSMFFFLLLISPLFYHFGLWRSPFFYLLPTQACLLLLRSVFIPIKTWQLLYSVAYLLLWIGITWWWGYTSFYDYLILKAEATT
jgi:fluoroquinolone transport system permease protein